QPRVFFDAKERYLAGAAEYREHRLLPPEVDGIVAPLAGRDLASVEIEDLVELFAGEKDSRGKCSMGESGGTQSARSMEARAAARAQLYGLGFAQRRLPGWTQAHDPRFAA